MTVATWSSAEPMSPLYPPKLTCWPVDATNWHVAAEGDAAVVVTTHSEACCWDAASDRIRSSALTGASLTCGGERGDSRSKSYRDRSISPKISSLLLLLLATDDEEEDELVVCSTEEAADEEVTTMAAGELCAGRRV